MRSHLALCPLPCFHGAPFSPSPLHTRCQQRHCVPRALQLVSRAAPSLGPGFLFQQNLRMCVTPSRPSLTPRSCHLARLCRTVPPGGSTFPVVFDKAFSNLYAAVLRDGYNRGFHPILQLRKWRFSQPVGNPLTLQESRAVPIHISGHLPTFFQVSGGCNWTKRTGMGHL